MHTIKKSTTARNRNRRNGFGLWISSTRRSCFCLLAIFFLLCKSVKRLENGRLLISIITDFLSVCKLFLCKNLSLQAYIRAFSANFAAYCVKNTCRATARLRIFALSATKLCSKIHTYFLWRQVLKCTHPKLYKMKKDCRETSRSSPFWKEKRRK